MLQAIRSKAGSRAVKGLFVVLIATFGIWGIGDIFRNRGPDTVVATVADKAIGVDALESALRPALPEFPRPGAARSRARSACR